MKDVPAPTSQDTAGRNVSTAELGKNKVQSHGTEGKRLFWQDQVMCMEGWSAWAREKSWSMRTVSETLDFGSVSILIQALLNGPKPSVCHYQRGRTRRHDGEPFGQDELPQPNVLGWLWGPCPGKKELTVGPVRRHSQQEQDTLPCFQAVMPEKIQAKKSKHSMFGCQLDPEVCPKSAHCSSCFS